MADQQRDAERIAAVLDAMTEDFAAELDGVLRLVTARIRALVKELEVEADGRLVANRVNLRRALRLRNDILQLLEQAGYVDLVTKATDAPLDRLATQVLRGDQQALDAFDLDVIVALKEIRLADLLQVGEAAAVTLWRTTVDGVLGLRPIVDLVQDVA